MIGVLAMRSIETKQLYRFVLSPRLIHLDLSVALTWLLK
jgi:hypothetical protein